MYLCRIGFSISFAIVFGNTAAFHGTAPTTTATSLSRGSLHHPSSIHHVLFSSVRTDTTNEGPYYSPALSPSGADLKSWGRGYTTCPKELPPTVLEIDLPHDFPTGTYYRNGAARYEADDGTKVLHPFDGDGMIVAMTFDPEQHPNQMLFRNKFVETEGYINDKATGTMSERGLFGTMKSGSILQNAFVTDSKNVANTNVLHAGDTLYALWEGGLPYKLNPLTLENVDGPGIAGETDLNGLTVTDNFAAHLRYDPKNKSYVNFAVKFEPSVGSTITLFEVDENTFRSTKPCSPSIVSEYPGLIHDFIITENYCLFNINKCELNGANGLKALLGLAGFASAIDVDNTATETSIVVIPRSLCDECDDIQRNEGIDYLKDDRIIVCKVPNHFNFHFGNAFEDDNGNIVFDTVETKEMDLGSMSSSINSPIWEKPGVYDTLTPNALVRYTLDIKNQCLAANAPPETLSTRIPEFPTIPKQMSTKRHRYLYPVASHIQMEFTTANKKGSGPAGAIQKVDTKYPDLTETFAFEPYEFPGEAVFAAKKGRDITLPGQEDAGYLLLHVTNGRDLTADFCIFDVEGHGSLSKKPIVRTTLPVFLPHMLHGNFFDGVTFDFLPFM